MRASLRRGAPGPQPQVKCSKWIQNGFCGFPARRRRRQVPEQHGHLDSGQGGPSHVIAHRIMGGWRLQILEKLTETLARGGGEYSSGWVAGSEHPLQDTLWELGG